MVKRAEGMSMRRIAREIGRDPATVSRELGRNAGVDGEYRASAAHRLAQVRAVRPKTAKLAVDGELRDLVQDGLLQRWSPRQISVRLAADYPDRPELQVSHETIYQSLSSPGFDGESVIWFPGVR